MKIAKKQAKEYLVQAFRGLPKRQRNNLLFHVEAGTAILCGNKANLWANEDAG